MKRSVWGKCPYPPQLVQQIEDILEKAIRFPGDLKALLRVLYICRTADDLENYRDLARDRNLSPFIRDKLKPLLRDAYSKHPPDLVRGAFWETIVYRQIRSVHSGRYEISRWPRFGDLAPVCHSCSAKSADVFESSDLDEVAIECKISLLIWLRNMPPEDDHLSCLEELRQNHSGPLRIVFATYDPLRKGDRVKEYFSKRSFMPDSILFDMASPNW